MTITKQRLALLGLLALTVAGAATISMPVYDTSAWIMATIRLSIVVLVGFNWFAWYRATTREDNS